MYCSACGQPIDPAALFCPACGARVSPSPGGPPLFSSSVPPPSDLTTLSHLVLVWDKLTTVENYQLQDPSGRPLGRAVGEIGFPVKYTVVDEGGRVVLHIDAKRAHGLLFDLLIHDAEGTVLATLHPESSVMSRKYGLSVGGQEGWLLTTDAMGYHYQVEEVAGGRVLATGDRKPALRTSTTEIVMADGQPLDHRVVIGAMILACYLTTRR